MDKMVAYCGLVCTECPVFLATQKNDDEEKRTVAARWSKYFGWDLKPSDINCDGCLLDDGRLFGYCQKCEARACGHEKRIENCAHCDDYACSKLDGPFKLDPRIKENLDKIRDQVRA